MGETDRFGVIIAGICWLLAMGTYLPYFAMVLAGRAQAHPITWGLYALTTGIIAGIQASQGAVALALATAAMAVCCAAITVAAACSAKSVRPNRIDYLLAAGSLLALCGWLLIDEPLVALAVLVAADVLATGPTIAGVLRDPWAEPAWAWLTHAARNALAIGAVSQVDALQLLAPVVLALTNGAVAAVVLIGRRRERLAGGVAAEVL